MEDFKALGIRVKYDDDDNNRPGWKFAEYELKGVPVRIAIGARDMENNVVEIARRDTKEKMSVSMDGLANTVAVLLNDIQQNIYSKAKIIVMQILQRPIAGRILKNSLMIKADLSRHTGMEQRKRKIK